MKKLWEYVGSVKGRSLQQNAEDNGVNSSAFYTLDSHYIERIFGKKGQSIDFVLFLTLYRHYMIRIACCNREDRESIYFVCFFLFQTTAFLTSQGCLLRCTF